MRNPTGVLETFRKLELHTKEKLADLAAKREAKLLVFSVLDICSKKLDIDELNAESISACLEAAGVDLSVLSIKRALANPRGEVTSKTDPIQGETVYRLMIIGRRKIENLFNEHSLNVIHITGSKQWSDRAEIGKIFKTFSGIIKISDPYLGEGTLELLHKLPKKTKIFFLYGDLSPSNMPIATIKSFVREKGNIEFRKTDKRTMSHDRLIINQNNIYLIGHGLKDVGTRESFIIGVDKGIFKNTIDVVESNFDIKWNCAQKI